VVTARVGASGLPSDRGESATKWPSTVICGHRAFACKQKKRAVRGEAFDEGRTTHPNARSHKGFRFVSTRRGSNPGVRGETRGVTLDRCACQTIAGNRLLDCCFSAGEMKIVYNTVQIGSHSAGARDQ